MANPRLEVDIVADTKSATKSINNLQRTGTTTTAAIAKGFIGAQIAIGAVTTATKGAVDFMKGSIEASNTQEAAITKLNAAMEAHGNYTEESSRAIQKFATEMQSATTIGDEETIAIAAQLEAMTGLTDEGLTKATQATIQLSKMMGIDLDAASKLVGKELTSTTSALTRYGIQIDKDSDSTDQLNQLLEATSSGMVIAEAEATTYEGRMSQLHNTFGDFQEVIGGTITKNEKLQTAISKLVKVATDMIGKLADWAIESGFADKAANALAEAVEWITSALDGTNEPFNDFIAGLQTVLTVGRTVVDIVMGINDALRWLGETAASISNFIPNTLMGLFSGGDTEGIGLGPATQDYLASGGNINYGASVMDGNGRGASSVQPMYVSVVGGDSMTLAEAVAYGG